METNLAPNPYQAPRADLSGGEPAAGQLSDEEIATFVGEGAAYYQRKWGEANRTGGFYAGFNLAALFVTTLWLLYRRMYLAFAIVLGIQTLGGMAAGLAFAMMGGSVLGPVTVVMLGTKVVLGFIGNGLYLRRARRAVAEARQGGAANLPFLRTRGGTSMASVAIGIAVNLLIGLLGR